MPRTTSPSTSLLAALGLALVASTAACTEVAPAPRDGLLLTEVAAAGDPHDWIEVLNVSGQSLDLVDYAYVDLRGDLDRARPFADLTLRPGQRHVQPVTETRSGFALGADEEVWILRADDGVIVDGLDWELGSTPAGGSLARLGDTGGFVTVAAATPGAPNQALR